MENQNNQYFIYIRSTGEKIPVTKEVQDLYMEDINTFRRKRQRHGFCQCPDKERLNCDLNCETCEYRVIPESITNLDAPVMDDSFRSMTTLEYLQERLPDLKAPSVEEYITTRLDAQRLLEHLQILMPEAIQIGKYRLQGLPDEEIAKKLGISRMTMYRRLQSLSAKIANELENFF